MNHTVEIQLKPEALERYGLPDITYPIRVTHLKQILTGGGDLPFALLLRGLQHRSQDSQTTDRQQDELAIDRLINLSKRIRASF